MAGSVNKVTLLGNLGQNPNIHTMRNGNKVVTFNLATSEGWKDKQTGERKEQTEWHKIVIYNEGLASIAEKYLRKGSKVYLEGQLKTRKWVDQQGIERYITEVVLQNYKGELTMVSSLEPSNPGQRQPTSAKNYQNVKNGNAPMPQNNFDDEVPF